jgi:hypothetical protein
MEGLEEVRDFFHELSFNCIGWAMAVNVGWRRETANSAPPARFLIPLPTVVATRVSATLPAADPGQSRWGCWQPIVCQEGRSSGTESRGALWRNRLGSETPCPPEGV